MLCSANWTAAADAIVHSTITEAYYDDDGNNGPSR